MCILTLLYVTNTFLFISFLLICGNKAGIWAIWIKKMPRHRDAAPSKYQNNVSNTNYYYYESY